MGNAPGEIGESLVRFGEGLRIRLHQTDCTIQFVMKFSASVFSLIVVPEDRVINFLLRKSEEPDVHLAPMLGHHIIVCAPSGSPY